MTADLDYPRITRRIVKLMAILTAAGALIFFVVKGFGAMLSFLGGAAISSLSFWLLHRMVADVTKVVEGEQVKPVSLLVHAFRMLILGGAAYAIVKTYGSFVPAVACGLTLAVTAATIEVLIELLYARA
ncbi:ATP synthase subunit I [uncultured Paludibaculum sp.]|uniref:ATP synthase subunit I n=1 Tax=uncultured Paludibaculum sp. TaxID=1765020 RepID=UPI002AAA78FE|nr:ATP synthase subunit I [uncultured Paludibaculum sp.]